MSLHGILESRTDKTDDLCIAAINEHFELSITAVDTKRTNRIGKQRDAGQTTRPIIIKFVRYNNRKNVYNRPSLLVLVILFFFTFGLCSRNCH